MSICVLCEKPSQAKDIAQVLGATSRQEGFIEGNGYIVTWCIGHLLRLAPPEEYCTNLQPWRMEVLPVIPSEWKLLPNPKTSKQLTVIKKLLKKTSHVIIATDADREGDVIGREVLEYCDYQDKIERLWLSALDEASIKKALSDIKPDSFSRDLYYAGLGRSRADWAVGMNLSMAATVKFSNGGGVLSVGRVQSPTLKLIVDRDFNVENFQPQNYYDLSITLTHHEGNFIAKWEAPESLADEAGRCLILNEAESVLKKIKDKQAKVTHYQSKEKTQSAPLGLSLSVLQKLCSSKFGFSAKKTLELAQSLYETHKATTYPRTDCVYLPTSQFTDAKAIIKLLNEKNKHYQEFIKKCDLSSQSSVWNDKKITAHHAIIPTLNYKVSIQSMSDDEKCVYDLICRYYMAQFLGDYRYLYKEIRLTIEQENFKASSHFPTYLGWKLALNNTTDKDKQESNASEDDVDLKQNIPEMHVDQSVNCCDAIIDAKQTKALPRFTEGALITAMKNIANYLEDKTAKTILRETAGIGTEATRANIIEILIARDYIERKGKHLISTSKGRKLISVLPSQVIDPIMTAHWESQLDDIAQGKAKLEDFMAAQKLQINDLLQALFSQKFQSINSETLNFSCEKCQKALVRRQGKFGYFWSCSGYPECSAKYKDIKGKPKFETNEYGCPECQTGYLQLRTAKKGKFWGCNGYPTCKTIVNDKRGKPETWRKKDA